MSPVDTSDARPLPSDSQHLYLVGFMGSGKSTLGRRLAELLRRPFLDLDEEIEREAGISISRIFELHGEEGFRTLEAACLRRVAGSRPSVVALGGGAFGSEANRSEIGRTGLSVWLDVDLESAWERCGGDPTRPLARSRKKFARLFQARIPVFEKADLRVKLQNDSPQTNCLRILKALGRHGDPSKHTLE